MNSLSVTVGAKGGGVQGYVSGSCLCFSKNHVVDPFRSTFTGTSGVLLKDGRGFRVRNAHRFRIYAKTRKGRKHDYPWPEDIDPNLNSGHLSYLSHFKPLAEKPKPVTLAFEKPLVDLEKKIIDVRKMAEETGLDFSDQINSLESKYQQALKDLYTHLTPIQRLNIARHPNRPTFLDHVLNITDKWVELHGDRAGYDDPAIVSGIGSIDGKSYLFIGHQKGRNTKENIHRNFGMPTPHGYRKALRMMRYADHHGFPIITFIDTPGAFADLKSEELGQGEAIAYNLRAMFGLKVPIVTVVIGEGGSGGALAIGCANKLFMLENSVFYVASPEACAAILWKTSQAAPKAAEKLKITAPELCKFKIADGIIPEPLGGAHTDPAWTSQQIKLVVMKAMEELQEMETDDLLNHRMLKFRSLGGFQEGIPVDPEKKRNMKSQDNVPATAALEAEIQNLKRKVLEAKEPSDPALNEAIEKLGEELDKELTEAFVSMGLQDKLESLKKEMAKNPNADIQPLNPGLKEKVDRLMQEFNQGLSQPGAFNELKVKLRLLTRVNRLVEQKPMGEKLKREINEKMAGEVREKLEVFKRARERLAAGERLDEDLKVSLERAKVELAGMLRSANLELVGVGKLKPPPPDLVEKMGKVREEIGREIERAVELTGLRAKLEEWKAELGKGLGKNSAQLEKIREEIAAIREQIAEAMDLTALNGKVDILTAEVGNGTGGDKNVTAEMPVEAVDGGELGGAALEEPLGDGGEQQIEEASLGWGQSEFDG